MQIEIEQIDVYSDIRLADNYTIECNYKTGEFKIKMATTPWQYLDNWSKSDRGPHETLEALNKRMQNRWPGNYKIVQEPKWNGHNCYISEYVFEFDSPRDKTWFRLQHP